MPLEFKEHFRDKFYAKISEKSVFHSNRGGGFTHNGLAPTRGFGYWCWKPKVILMALEQIKEGDLLIFCDIGFEFEVKNRDALLEMLKDLDENEMLGAIMKYPEKEWNKADLLEHFGLLENKEFLESGQCAAGIVFLKKTQKTMRFVQEWLDVFESHFHLVDDSPSKIPNLPEFRENRHDQSIYSILNKKYKVKNYPYGIFGSEAPLQYNRNKIYLPNNAKEMKTINEFLRDKKRGNYHLTLQDLQQRIKDSLHALESSIAYRGTASARIHSHLAYKLGSAMTLNARSLLGWVRMPYVLSFIKESHKEEQRKYQIRIAKNPSLKLPKLESYPDYKEAIKEKQCFTYKLGQALIEANSAGGGANICLFAILQKSA